MKKLMLTVIAGCMSAALASAYAATGSPADSDKAGRQGPGTAAGQQGATDPNAPSKAGTKGGAAATAPGAAASSTGAGASATTSPGAAAGSAGGMDDTKGRRTRRAARAEKG